MSCSIVHRWVILRSRWQKMTWLLHRICDYQGCEETLPQVWLCTLLQCKHRRAWQKLLCGGAPICQPLPRSLPAFPHLPPQTRYHRFWSILQSPKKRQKLTKYHQQARERTLHEVPQRRSSQSTRSFHFGNN